jgi:predicted benzoate:H+ symporter BenE
MRRRWNGSLWTGFLLVVAGLMSYVPVFSLFPITRDFPWVNLLFMIAGAVFLAAGLKRAFKQPELYRGRILGPIFTALSIAGVGMFVYGLFILGRQLPVSTAAPRAGQKAPEFDLPDQTGKATSLAELLASSPGAGGAPAKGALLIFYRGYW